MEPQTKELLLKSYNVYQDSASRTAVMEALTQFLKSSDFEKAFVKFVNHAAHSRMALTDTLTLIQWTVLTSNSDIVEAQASLLCNAAERSSKLHGLRIYKSVIANVKQSLLEYDPRNVADLVTKACAQPAEKGLIYIGVLAEAAYDLQPVKPAFFSALDTEDNRKKIIALLVNALSGKTAIAEPSLVLFGRYLTHIVPCVQFVGDVLPSLEKAILRSSEVGLATGVALFKGCNYDMSEHLPSSKLFTHIVNGLKSTKENVRSVALELFTLVVKSDVSQTLFTALKGTSNADAKLAIAKAIERIPHTKEPSFLSGLAALVSKEPNEPVLEALVSAYVSSWADMKSDDFATIKSGLESVKWPVKRVWFTALAIQFGPSDMGDRLAPISENLRKAVDEADKGALAIVASKGIACALAALTLLSGSTATFPYNVKVMTKLTESELLWCVRALAATKSSDETYFLAFLYFAASRNVSFKVKQEALKHLKAHAFGDFLSAINTALSEKAEDYDFDLKSFAPVLNALTRQDPSILGKCFVAAHHPAISVKDGWIGLCLRASVDPMKIIEENSERLVAEVAESLMRDTASALAALATIAFVCPALASESFSQIVKEDLSPPDIDQQSISIWHGSGDEPVVDVLSKGKRQDTSKGSKDYETRQWEENLKKELASKNKVAKKLTREEQQLVAEQLKKEALIRAEMQKSLEKLRRGCIIIRQLVKEPSLKEYPAWFHTACDCLLLFLVRPYSADLVGSFAVETFLSMSALLSNGLGELKEMTGAAVLRQQNVPGIPEQFLETPLLGLIGRVLFRLKLLSNDSVDNVSFSYVLPLLVKVLDDGRRAALVSKKVSSTEFEDEDPVEEQLLLALEFVSSQAQMFEHEAIPRRDVLEIVLSLMRIPSKAKLAKECFLTLCQHISVNIDERDLQFLFSQLITSDTFVKSAVIEGLDAEFDLTGVHLDEVWICKFDHDDHVAETAATIWDESGMTLPEDAPTRLLAFVGNEDSGLRLTVARAIVAAIQDNLAQTLDNLIILFYEKEVPPPPQKDEFGMIVHTSQKDEWEDRSTVAIALKLIAALPLTEAQVEQIFHFLVTREVLGDKEDLVGQELLEAGTEVIQKHGQHVEILLPMFEECLGAKDTGSKKQDKIKERVVVMYGTLARHLSSGDERLQVIVERLLSTLDLPSESIQYAISECLAPLVPLFEDAVGGYLERLFEKLWNGKSLAVRKGSAYGILGLCKGSGIRSLFSHGVMRQLSDAAEDKKEQVREGVAFVLDCLSQSMGSRFEPYVIEMLPLLLRFLGDSSALVRAAADTAATQMMKTTTSYGVKRMIPVAVDTLQEYQWRLKRGAVELLGLMAYLDPTQLSALLLTIVPELVGVLNDTHKEVRKAADAALRRFGEVIRNPEIQAIVPELIKAIGDPTQYTEQALDRLIQTQFVHYIDGPSLALIIHVIHRGMRERLATTKRKACQIVGNMAILVDKRDLVPYLPQLVAELETAMVDPVPATRSTGARALGLLVERLGEEQLPDLIDRLLATLLDPQRAGDRMGSAQALAEVVAGLGVAKLDELLPVVVENATSHKEHMRAGFMPLLLYLPVCFGSQFAPYLGRIVPPILAGLADTEEVRETALKAGRLIVTNYASKAVDLLLPELEKGLAHELHRIRLSSLELTADLLFQVMGISSKSVLEEHQLLAQALGQERRDRVLAALFVCRSDSAAAVRLAAVDVWKAMVPNTPKTVKEIIPALTQNILVRLAAQDPEQRAIAAAALGDVVRRVGAGSLLQLLPGLEAAAKRDANARQGLCVALSELVAAALDELVATHKEMFVLLVREALVDPNREVRELAAAAFEALQRRIGREAVDAVVPRLLAMLLGPDAEHALGALKDLMAAGAELLPALLPALLAPPLDDFKAAALASVAEVAGPALYPRLSKVIDTLLGNDALNRVLALVGDDGVHPLMQHLLSLVKHQDVEVRRLVCEHLKDFFGALLDLSVYILEMAQALVGLLGDSNVAVPAQEALQLLVKHQDKATLETLVRPLAQALSLLGTRDEPLPGLLLPRGPGCLVPVFAQGLMYGTADQRQFGAMGMRDVAQRSPEASLRPFVTAMAGPLIRVVGERVLSDVKVPILEALLALLNKVPQALRPFVPQLQRTFVRSLDDKTLAPQAVICLSQLVAFQPRVDSLVAELVLGSSPAHLEALLAVVQRAGAAMSETSRLLVLALVESTDTGVVHAKLLGVLARTMPGAEAAALLRARLRGPSAVLVANSFLKDAPEHVEPLLDEVVEAVVELAALPRPEVSDRATVALGKLLLRFDSHAQELLQRVLQSAVSPESNSSDTRRLALVVLRTVAREKYATVKLHWDVVVPAVFACLRDAVIPIRLAAEKAYLAVFNLVEDAAMKDFETWFAAQTEIKFGDRVFAPRSVGDYTKRVAARLAAVERERIEAGGDAEQMFSDRFEDEAEVWSV